MKPIGIFADDDEDLTLRAESSAQFQTDKETLAKLKPDDLISFNSEAEQQFVDFVCSLCSEFEKLTQRDVIQESSFELNISPVTAKRYLLKHTARRARFEIVNSFVRCRCDRHRRRYDVKIIKRT